MGWDVVLKFTNVAPARVAVVILYCGRCIADMAMVTSSELASDNTI